MDNVITSLVVLDGQGNVNEYVGGYSDWEARGGSLEGATAGASTAIKTPEKEKQGSEPKQLPAKQVKLSYKDQRELGSLPAKIEKLETQQAQLEKQMSEPGFYQSDQEKIRQVTAELAQVQSQMESAFSRWAELEDTKSPKS